MVQRIRDESPVLREMEAQGKILIVGALYDVETSLASWLED
jgi:carbonic anhydrase